MYGTNSIYSRARTKANKKKLPVKASVSSAVVFKVFRYILLRDERGKNQTH